MTSDSVGVAIVGGGVSGLYTAWRLACAGGSIRGGVNVYEASERVGGRLDTVEVPEETTRVEFGAMRLPVSHVLANSLLQHLRVPVEPFPNLTLRQLYLRGKPIPFGPQGPLNEIPFRLTGTESSNPFMLLVQALERAVPNALSLTPSQWDTLLRNLRINERFVWQWGFWNLLKEFVSNEAYEFMFLGVGIESSLANWNSASALETMSLLVRDFNAGKFVRPSEGWSQLPERLAKELTSVPGFGIKRRCTLRALRRAPGRPARLELVFSTPRGEHRVLAREVVLALPRRALELVMFDSKLVPDGAAFAIKLAEVRQMPAFRLYIAYNKPWWQRQAGWSDGFMVTDLPVRQVFYGAGLGKNQKQTERILMASYSDFHAVDFWTGLTDLKSRVEHRKDLNQGALGAVLESAERQLCELHGITGKLPAKDWVRFQDWTKETHGAAWHMWRPGVEIRSAIRHMRHPLPDVPIYVCGEAYSRLQGWVEGALCSAELMLQQLFGLSQPEWLPRDYELGP
jgi:monoamine oxidase